MKGLLLKDLFNLKSQTKVFAIFPLLAAFFSYQTKSLNMLQFYICMIVIFVIMSTCSYDEMADFNSYALTLPLTKNDIVLSKYVLSCTLSIISCMMCIIIANILILVLGSDFFTEYEWKQYIISSIAISVTMNAISCMILPLLFKFGAEKGRMMMILLFLGCSVFVYMISNADLSFISQGAIQFLENYILYIIVAIMIIIEAGSIMISNHIMKQKEF